MGRMRVLMLPRPWVLQYVEEVADEALGAFDYWNYGRLLEVYTLLDSGLVARLVARGRSSTDVDVKEAAEDFGNPSYMHRVRLLLGEQLVRLYPQVADVLADPEMNEG